MAFDPGSNTSPSRRSRGEQASPAIADVGRPAEPEWSALERDGVHWEGQVVITGAGTHLPARLILTRTRLVLSTGSAIALDVPQTWLRPQPMLMDGDTVRLSLTPEGTRISSETTERLVIRMRGGRGAAAQLIRAITGRMASPRAPERRAASQIAEAPAWSDRVGAAAPIALPPLPDLGDDDAEKQPWPPVEQHALPPARPRQQASASRDSEARSTTQPSQRERQDAGSQAAGRRVAGGATADPLPGTALTTGTGFTASYPRSGRVAAQSADVDDAQTFVAAEPHQFNRALVWGLRTLILAVLVGTGLYFEGDRFPLPAKLDLNLPANLESRLGFDENSDQIAADPGQTGTTGTENGAEEAVTSEQRTEQPSDGTSGPPNGDAVQPDADGDDDSAIGGTTGPLSPTEVATGEPAPTDVPVPADLPVESGGNDDGTIGDESTDGAADVLIEEPAAPTDAPVEVVPTAEPEPEPTIIPTEVPTVVPTDVPTEEPTQEPTAVPTEEPTPVPTQEPTVAPTEEPTTVPTQEPTAAPTEEPTPVPTTVPTQTPTPVPTQEPNEEPTQTPVPTAVPTVVPTPTAVATEAPGAEPTAQPLPPSVDPGTPPAQSVATGPFRFSIQGAAGGDTIEELPQLTDVGSYGEWVVLSLYGENWSDSEQVFDMSQFTLIADGEEIPLDVGTSWVASQIGFTPAYGNTDAVSWDPDEGHPFALTFLVPPATETLVLQAGDQVIDLGATLENPGSLAQESDAATEQEYIEAKVVEIVDGETIIVEWDGSQQEVRYLGIDAPTGDDCYAGEATAAHTDLVEGKTVRIERQATDVDAQGNWVRDVWVEAEEGRFFLVSETLVGEGAAEADVSEPNTRFAGWLMGSESAARAESSGLWGACDTEATGWDARSAGGTDGHTNRPYAIGEGALRGRF